MNGAHDYHSHQQGYLNFTRAIGIGIIGVTLLLVFMALYLV
ncbi:MAG: aa3-type cytochrome c oxidase subunit IV [Alphaproteobacteria bacterium]|nr:aa3-type cytochrome c oxidase subunit IV [Alphaproteobacteria bacterium]